MMKTAYRVLGGSLLLGLVTVVVAVLVGLGARDLLVPRLSTCGRVDVGILRPGQTELHAVLAVENTGWRRLIIDDVVTCCGISLPYGFPKEIAGQSKAYVVLRADLPRSNKPYRRSVTLITNDPVRRRAQVELYAEPDRSVVVVPPSISLGYVTPGAARPGAVRVIVKEAGWLPRHISTSSDNIFAVFHADGDKNTGSVEIRVSDACLAGKLAECVYVRTGYARRPNIIIPVSAFVERSWRPRPRTLFFGVVEDSDKAIVESIRLLRIDPKAGPPRIAYHPYCVGARLTEKPDDSFELRVELDMMQMPNILRDHVIIEDGAGNATEVPIIAVRRKTIDSEMIKE